MSSQQYMISHLNLLKSLKSEQLSLIQQMQQLWMQKERVMCIVEGSLILEKKHMRYICFSPSYPIHLFLQNIRNLNMIFTSSPCLSLGFSCKIFFILKINETVFTYEGMFWSKTKKYSRQGITLSRNYSYLLQYFEVT